MFYQGWIKSGQLKVIDTFDSNWKAFEERRRKHNDNIFEETNKLILRLDKLINPENGSHSADLDKSLVEWTSDELVKLCPFCAKAFNLARRRHHCRVCGAILCQNCSRFLPYHDACKLVKPAKLYVDPYDRIQDRLEERSAEEMPNIRTCEDCKRLLDKRIQIIEDHYSQPSFLHIYEKLRISVDEADRLILLQSNQQEVKAKIQELRESVVRISAKIRKLSEKDKGDKQAYLLSAIAQCVSYWLKESIDDKINRLRSQLAGSTGWVPDQPTNLGSRSVDEDENPLLTQIKNLEEYIRQAKSAGRYEEVESLAANKRDLEIEYFIQQDLSSLSMAERLDEEEADKDNASGSQADQ